MTNSNYLSTDDLAVCRSRAKTMSRVLLEIGQRLHGASGLHATRDVDDGRPLTEQERAVYP